MEIIDSLSSIDCAEEDTPTDSQIDQLDKIVDVLLTTNTTDTNNNTPNVDVPQSTTDDTSDGDTLKRKSSQQIGGAKKHRKVADDSKDVRLAIIADADRESVSNVISSTKPTIPKKELCASRINERMAEKFAVVDNLRAVHQDMKEENQKSFEQKERMLSVIEKALMNPNQQAESTQLKEDVSKLKVEMTEVKSMLSEILAAVKNHQ